MHGFLNTNTNLSTFSQVRREERIPPSLQAGLVCCSVSFGTSLFSSLDSPANRAPISEAGSSFQKQAETEKSIDSSFTLNAVFGMKRITGYKLKSCSLLGLMVVLVIFKYSVGVRV